MILKKYIIGLMILTALFQNTKLFGQSIEVLDDAKYQFKYLLTYQTDSTDVNSLEMEEMILIAGNHISKFQSLGGYLKDSISNNIDKGELNSINLMSLMGNIPKTKFKEVIIKDYSNNKLTYREQVFRDYFEYKDSLNIFKWTINEENRQINGYNCQKATMKYAGRKFIAWYTKEIPISDGPYKFNGLPGLITQINDTDNQYLYDLIEVKKIDGNKITKKKKNHIATTKKELRKIKKEFYENIFKKLEQSGISLNFDNPSQKKNTLNKYNKRNNPIELKDTDE